MAEGDGFTVFWLQQPNLIVTSCGSSSILSHIVRGGEPLSSSGYRIYRHVLVYVPTIQAMEVPETSIHHLARYLQS
jgi:hypothetical protein